MISYQLSSSGSRDVPQFEAQQIASPWRAALAAHPMFQMLDAADMDQLLLRSKTLVLRPRQLLVREAEPASRFFFLLEGSVKLFRLTHDGTEKILGAVPTNSCIGEACVFKEEPRYACYAESLELCKLLVLPSAQYRDLIIGRPEYSRAVLAYLAQGLHSKLQDLEVLTTQNARERVMDYLRALLPESAVDGTIINLPMPKAMLASRLAMQPETLSRVLGGLRRDGILSVDRRRLMIEQIDAFWPETRCSG